LSFRIGFFIFLNEQRFGRGVVNNEFFFFHFNSFSFLLRTSLSQFTCLCPPPSYLPPLLFINIKSVNDISSPHEFRDQVSSRYKRRITAIKRQVETDRLMVGRSIFESSDELEVNRLHIQSSRHHHTQFASNKKKYVSENNA